MKKKVIQVEDVASPFAYADGTTGYRTDDGQLYVLGLNLRHEQVQNVRGGLRSGGETYLYVR